jgi:hypothetical protein
VIMSTASRATALFISLCTLATAVAPLTTLVAAPHSGSPPAALLHEPLGYVLLGPLSSILDAFTLMSPAQGWTMFGTIVVICLVGMFARRRARVLAAQRVPSLGKALVVFAVRTVIVTLAVGELIVVAPRPMARMQLGDPQLLAVDFHSHTSDSHDGRPGFDVEANREWERHAGFDAAYVTDHRTFNAAILAGQRNPALAGEGTILLPGIELRDGSEHDIVIGADPRRSNIPDPELRDATLVPENTGFLPILIRAMPGNDRTMESPSIKGVDLRAIEISDGSPRGLAQTSGDASTIGRLCQSRPIACVSGSDNHGWSRTPAAWSILRIPEWRQLTPAALDLAIRQAIAGKRDGVQVLMRRRVPPATSTVGTFMSAFVVAGVMLRELDWPMRLSWILWPWAFVALASIRLPQRESRRGANVPQVEPLVLRTLRGFQGGSDAA